MPCASISTQQAQYCCLNRMSSLQQIGLQPMDSSFPAITTPNFKAAGGILFQAWLALAKHQQFCRNPRPLINNKSIQQHAGATKRHEEWFGQCIHCIGHNSTQNELGFNDHHAILTPALKSQILDYQLEQNQKHLQHYASSTLGSLINISTNCLNQEFPQVFYKMENDFYRAIAFSRQYKLDLEQSNK